MHEPEEVQPSPDWCKRDRYANWTSKSKIGRRKVTILSNSASATLLRNCATSSSRVRRENLISAPIVVVAMNGRLNMNSGNWIRTPRFNPPRSRTSAGVLSPKMWLEVQPEK
jgi:hypothetical protein